MKFGLQAILTATPDNGQLLADIMLQAATAVATIDGCELYVVQRSLTQQDDVLITEVWQSQNHHQASLQNPDVQALIAQAKPLIANMAYHPASFIAAHGIHSD